MTTIGDEIVQLEQMAPAVLRERWRSLFRKDVPPHTTHQPRTQVASRLQEREQGGLSRSAIKQLERFKQTKSAAANSLAPGTRLIREWNGHQIEVLVLGEGYRFEDRHFRSLSQIARHVTGAHCSGPRFFGLKAGKTS